MYFQNESETNVNELTDTSKRQKEGFNVSKGLQTANVLVDKQISEASYDCGLIFHIIITKHIEIIHIKIFHNISLTSRN